MCVHACAVGGDASRGALGIRNHQRIPTAMRNSWGRWALWLDQTKASGLQQRWEKGPDISKLICSTLGDNHHAVFVESRQKQFPSKGGSRAERFGNKLPEFKFHSATLCVNLVKLPKLSVSQFLHMVNGDNSVYLIHIF